jgi:secreted trypsin-like serine protease
MKHCQLFTVTALAIAMAACAPAKQSESLVASDEASQNIVAGDLVKSNDVVAASTVALYIRGEDGDGVCSGTLIAPNVVLTAAHCVIGMTGAVVVFGLNLETATDAQMRGVDLVAVHPQFAAKAAGQGGWNDLALFRFQGAAPASAKIAQILDKPSVLKSGLKAVLAGYGTTKSHGMGTDDGTLRKVTLAVQNPAYEQTELSFAKNTKGGSACHGDSGGPAYITQNGKLTVIGITSRGTTAACNGISISTSVASHAAYIKETAAALQAAPPPTQE